MTAVDALACAHEDMGYRKWLLENRYEQTGEEAENLLSEGVEAYRKFRHASDAGRTDYPRLDQTPVSLVCASSLSLGACRVSPPTYPSIPLVNDGQYAERRGRHADRGGPFGDDRRLHFHTILFILQRMATVRKTISLPAQIARRLDTEAKRRRTSVSAIVTELVQRQPEELPYAGLIDDDEELSQSVEQVLARLGT